MLKLVSSDYSKRNRLIKTQEKVMPLDKISTKKNNNNNINFTETQCIDKS